MKAQGIAYFSRYIEPGRPTLEMPVLVCQSCHEAQSRVPSPECWNPYSAKPLDARNCLLCFTRIQACKKEDLPGFWNLRRLEVNQLRHPRWKKTLWRIWFLGRSRSPVWW
ncbi:MAG: hypothetical protein HYU36_22180 [Planctomycetes bacterium]|nr:hypothetical protein [Planctomycetota bacterium]